MDIAISVAVDCSHSGSRSSALDDGGQRICQQHNHLDELEKGIHIDVYVHIQLRHDWGYQLVIGMHVPRPKIFLFSHKL